MNLIVIDLDSTLISFDSFRFLTIKNLYRPKVLLASLLRSVRLIRNYTFKKYVTENLKSCGWFDKNMDEFVQNLYKKVNINILNKISLKAGEGDLIVLCSASPHIYVSELALKLGWIGFGSSFERGNQFHLYSEHKHKFILEKFNKNEFVYKYAISDSKKDLPLLKEFISWELYQS